MHALSRKIVYTLKHNSSYKLLNIISSLDLFTLLGRMWAQLMYVDTVNRKKTYHKLLKLCFGYQKEREGRHEILKYNWVGNFDELWDNLKPSPITHDTFLYLVDDRTQERPFDKDAQTEQRHASDFLYPTLVSFRCQMKHFTAWLIHKTYNTTQYPLHHTIER